MASCITSTGTPGMIIMCWSMLRLQSDLECTRRCWTRRCSRKKTMLDWKTLLDYKMQSLQMTYSVEAPG
jgi:hypothetical protein